MKKNEKNLKMEKKEEMKTDNEEMNTANEEINAIKEDMKATKEEIKTIKEEIKTIKEKIKNEKAVNNEIDKQEPVKEEPTVLVKDEIAATKKIGILGYMSKVSDAVLKTLKRFPLTILICISLAAIAIYRIEVPYERLRDYNEILDRIMATLALGIPLSLSVNLLYERFRPSAVIEKVLSYFLQLALLWAYYQYALINLSMVSGVRHMCLIFSLVIAFLVIPYLYRKENYEVYITRLASKAVVTVFFMAVLGAGICAILFAVKSLLYAQMNSNYYIYTWIITWFVCAPIHFLHGLPKNDQVFEVEDYNKVLRVLLFYIVMPILAVYTLVLYLYFGKIIVTRVWPNGIVSYLVLSYTAALMATIFLITPLKILNSWVKKFYTIFPILIFPLLVMMFISMGTRIGEYGITENRYFVMVIGAWATLAFIYINFNKGRRNILLPISLAVVLIIMVSGPLSAFNLSMNSQNARFYKILTKNNMLNNGQIIKNDKIDKSDKKEIVAIMRYFENFHNLSDLKYLPNGFTSLKTEEVFGFAQDEFDGNYRIDGGEYFSYSVPEVKSINIAGFDSLYKLGFYKGMVNGDNIFEEGISSGTNAKIRMDKNYKLSIINNDTEIFSKDLNEFIKALYEKYGTNNKYMIQEQQDMTYIYEDGAIKIKIIFNNISGQCQLNDTLNIDNFDAYVFVKINQ